MLSSRGDCDHEQPEIRGRQTALHINRLLIPILYHADYARFEMVDSLGYQCHAVPLNVESITV
jgi:hypothetical protein